LKCSLANFSVGHTLNFMSPKFLCFTVPYKTKLRIHHNVKNLK
jgi:hypothetical protein